MKHQFTEVRVPIELDNPSIERIEELCIKCGLCKNVCENDIAVANCFNLNNTCDKAVCINCGQCANVCPIGAIKEKYEYAEVKKAIKDKNKIVIFSTSPSVRVALGEEFGQEAGTFVQNKMVAALKALGADFVLDTNFAADLTIMEEASELIERVVNKKAPLPQFTSCCPAWVKYVETFYPEFIPNLSTSKSPIGMQGATVKTYFAKKMMLDPNKIVHVAVTPCTAKKFEIRREEMNASSKYLGIDGMRDTDNVITTRELAKWIKEENIDFNNLKDINYDSFMGEASGAAIIFGNTGGVMEAAARTAYKFIEGKNPSEVFYSLTPVRGMEGIREASITLGSTTLKLAVVHGTANAKILLEKLKRKEVNYDFIEVMTCRGGCIGGGGQPKTVIPMNDEIRQKRINGLYNKDREVKTRLSYENIDIKTIYTEFYKKPLSELSEKMLHTFYTDRSSDLGNETTNNAISEVAIAKDNSEAKNKNKFKCLLCGYEHETELDKLPIDFTCPMCFAEVALFERI